jgi:hypothetical protein
MKHFVILLVVAIITLAIMFAIYRPDIVKNVWLWLIGLIGPIIGFSQKIIDSIDDYLKK